MRLHWLPVIVLSLVLIVATGHAATPDAEAGSRVFVPLAAGAACGPFRDGFDGPTGWYTGERDGLLAELTGGEYRLLITQPGAVWFVGAPDCERLASTAAVDARWASQPGNFYGLLFGTAGRLDRSYLLAVNTDSRVWLVFEISDKGMELVTPPTASDAVRPAGEVNRLAASRQGERIILSVNGVAVGELPDPAPGEPFGAGLAAATYTFRAPADVRFDNFNHMGNGQRQAVGGEPRRHMMRPPVNR